MQLAEFVTHDLPIVDLLILGDLFLIYVIYLTK